MPAGNMGGKLDQQLQSSLHEKAQRSQH